MVVFLIRNLILLDLELIIKKWKTLLKRISWWGIFYIKNNKAYISSLRHFNHDRTLILPFKVARLLIEG